MLECYKIWKLHLPCEVQIYCVACSTQKFVWHIIFAEALEKAIGLLSSN